MCKDLNESSSWLQEKIGICIYSKISKTGNQIKSSQNVILGCQRKCLNLSAEVQKRGEEPVTDIRELLPWKKHRFMMLAYGPCAVGT